MKTGIAELPLHTGHCPKWLFLRMKKFAKAVCEAIIIEYGTEELLKKLSNPYFFQAFSCAAGFDWHSSGTTTTLCGAIKEAGLEEYGIAVCGGKGKVALKTPEEIKENAKLIGVDEEKMIYTSRMCAKVDNAALQDGFELYHHVIIFDEHGNWCVVQQGMNASLKYARRYHWFNTADFVSEPHAAVCCDKKVKPLNLVAEESKEARKCITDLACEGEQKIKKLVLSSGHWFDTRPYEKTFSVLNEAREAQPRTFEEILAIKGIGAKALRALALIAKLIYGCELSWRDPVKYSFAHGGKDGVPYPVDKKLYDTTILTLEEAIQHAKLGKREKLHALKALEKLKI